VAHWQLRLDHAANGDLLASMQTCNLQSMARLPVPSRNNQKNIMFTTQPRNKYHLDYVDVDYIDSIINS
jgi:hypothetical protein